jgi:type II secretory pathway pseudopilin PulG
MIEIIIVLVILATVVGVLTRGSRSGKDAALVQVKQVDARGRLATSIYSACASATDEEKAMYFVDGRDISEFIKSKGNDLKMPNDRSKEYKVMFVAANSTSRPPTPAKVQVYDPDTDKSIAEVDLADAGL